jgi:uncharacterized protein DUF4124
MVAVPARLLALAAAALALCAPASAQTFKWVDEKGVVNYSNNPPPAAAASAARKAAQVTEVVEDRLSTYESDPALQRPPALRAPGTPDYAQLEWLQRQRYLMDMATAQAAAHVDCDYRNDCRSAYYYPYLSVATIRPARIRPTFFTSGSRIVR